MNRFVAAFIGSSNFIEAKVVRHSDDATEVETTSGLRLRGLLTDRSANPDTGTSVTVAIRPERFEVTRAPESAGVSSADGWTRVPGRVSQGTYLGDSTEYRVATDAVGNLVIRVQNSTGESQDQAFGPGEAVVVGWEDRANLVLAQ